MIVLQMFTNFYDLSPLLIMLRLCFHIKVVSGYNNIFHLRFCKAFSPLLMLRLPSQQPHSDGTSGKSLENSAACTKSLFEVCFEYPYNKVCLEYNMHVFL